MESVNDLLLNESISHQVDLRRYENGVVRRMIAVLNRSDARLFEQLTLALQQVDPASFTMERLESLLASVRSLNAQAYAKVAADMDIELKKFAAYEVAYQNTTLVALLPVQVQVATVTAEQVYTAAMARPFQGGLLKTFLAELDAGKSKKIRQAVAQGFVENKTTDQIVRELRGTRAKGYADGLLEVTRRDAQAVVRTALAHMAGFVQDRTTAANVDIIKAVVWHSTLDGRTSEICIVRDLLEYTPKTHQPIGHSIPWLGGPGRAHWGCRSAQTYVLKSNAELGIPGADIDLGDGSRASMDGQVPAGTTYAQWLTKQSAARQDEVLGAKRGAMLRNGEYTVGEFFNDKGVFLTLEQLAARSKLRP